MIRPIHVGIGLLIGGVGAVIVGLALIYIPAAFICAGLAASGVGIAILRGAQP